ncbi:MAG: glycosyltransferase family 4 protein [Clostridiales bacterium]|nr:glycosyltransferase family 4 protein [Clostridiales bacterium]
MKKALIVANLGGFFYFLFNDIKILQDKGYKVYCAAQGNLIKEEDPASVIRSKGAEFINIDFDSKKIFSKNNLTAYKQMKRLLKEHKFDLIHCHTPIAGAITRLAAKKYRRKNKTKVFYTTHGFSFTKYSDKKEFKKYFGIENFLSKYTDLIVTINNEDFEYAKKMKARAVEKINGVGFDYERFHNVDIDRDKWRKSLNINETDILILSVGELSARKNHQLIVKAIAKLNNPNIVYVIAGRELPGSGVKEGLETLAKNLGVRLILLGHISKVPEAIKCSDIGAIPSIREGLGLAGVQSLAGGVPLIGTDVQGIREYVIDGVTGYITDAFNEDECANKIKLLIENKDKMVENCFETAKKFDRSVSYGQMEKIYSKYIGEDL